MPAPGKYESSASKYSWVAAGPPCSRSTLMRGLLPTRLVHTRKGPLGVWTVMRRTPPVRTSPRPVWSKYEPGRGLFSARVGREHSSRVNVKKNSARECHIDLRLL